MLLFVLSFLIGVFASVENVSASADSGSGVLSSCVLTDPTSQACKDLGVKRWTSSAGAAYTSIPTAKLDSVQLFSSSQSVANDWAATNCKRVTSWQFMDSVYLYLWANQHEKPPSSNEQFQVDKEYTVSITGMSGSTQTTVDSSDGSISMSFWADGSQTSKLTGTPRTITVRAQGGGHKDPTCSNITIYRAAKNYVPALNIDKASAAANEAFQVTVTGLPVGEVYGGGLTITYPTAPSDSCMNPNRGTASLCAGDQSMNCSTIPSSTGNGTETYTCIAADYSHSGVDKNDVAYTFSYAAGSPLDTFSASNSKSITIKKAGTSGSPTSYGNCGTGKGVDPFNIQNGCVDCGYIREEIRKGISTCSTTAADVFKWIRKGLASNQPSPPVTTACSAPAPKDDGSTSCSVQWAGCVANGYVYSCEIANAPTNAHSGYVLGEDGKPLSWVRVQGISGYDSGFNSDVITTGSDGHYVLTNEKVTNIITLKKNGYVDRGISPVKPGQQDTVTLTTVGPTLSPGYAIMSMSADKNSGSTVSYRVDNLPQELTEVCYGVLEHPNSALYNIPTVGYDYCNYPSHFMSFNGNADWTYSNGGWNGTIAYDKNIYGASGIKVLIVFRNSLTKQSASSTMTVQ